MVENLAAVYRDGVNANDCRRDQDSVPARRRSVRIQSECRRICFDGFDTVYFSSLKRRRLPKGEVCGKTFDKAMSFCQAGDSPSIDKTLRQKRIYGSRGRKQSAK